MSISTAVETIEKGDRIEVWLGDAPQAVVVCGISEGETFRTFQVNHAGAALELNVPLGYAVNLCC